MKIYRGVEQLHIKDPVVTIGTFDGVHKGHKHILQNLQHIASQTGGESLIITFWPHPRHVVLPESPLKLLNTLEERIELFEKQNVQHLAIVEFSPAFSKLSFQEFIQNFLVKKVGVKHLVVGYDHHFGHNREGSLKSFQNCAKRYGFGISKVEALSRGEKSISSTKVRSALAGGNVRLAQSYLGYEYFFSGIVQPGDRIGRALGFPTANLDVSALKLLPARGVYAVEVEKAGKILQGMMNIGLRPTAGLPQTSATRVEVHIFDFQETIYGEKLRVTIKDFIRPEEKFDSPCGLKAQLAKDKQTAQNLLRKEG